MSRTNLSAASRHSLYLETDGRCFYCGIDVRLDAEHQPQRDWLLVRQSNTMVADHAFPRIRGGRNDVSNLVCCCYSCNAAKGALSMAEFRFVRGLRARDLSFVFPFEMEDPDKRDWLCVYSDEQIRELFFHNFPDSAVYYARGNSIKQREKNAAKIRSRLRS